MTAGVNTAGHFLMRADKVGQETTLAQIIRLVDEATSSKAPIARMADRISGVFVPVVIAIAVIAAAVWLMCGAGIEFALSIGIAVLVISCPCALGLATPTAIMVGTGRGAARGVLFKSAAALETAGRVDTVALDKTGTLTIGKPHVTGIVTVDGVSQDEVLTAAVSLEKCRNTLWARRSSNGRRRTELSRSRLKSLTRFRGRAFREKSTVFSVWSEMRKCCAKPV